ncbi:MAG: T9SS type A sorting domain-containing protein [Flavobacteriales bacterium]|nr:T9SS type A sorting domain-containing protein [Flavobacteriales bacterium]
MNTKRNAPFGFLYGTSVIFLLALSSNISAQEIWTGNVNSDWENGGNWASGLPSSGDDVKIDPGNYTGANAHPTISINSTFSPAEVEVKGTAVLTIQANLTTSDKVKLDGGNSTAPTINMSGGTLDITGNTNLEVKKGAVFNLTGGTVTVSKDLSVEEGTFNIDESDGPSSLTTDSDSDGDGKLKIKCKGNANSLFNMDAGTGTVASLEMDGNGDLGAFSATLDISGGTFTNNGKTKIKKNEGDDTPIVISGGTVTLTGDIADNPAGKIDITVSGGTLVLQDNLTMEAGDQIVHSGGDIRFEGATKTWVNVGVLTSTGGSIEFQGSRTLSGAGTFTFYDVKVTNAVPTALALTVTRNVTIGNKLDMSGGTIDITGFELEIGTGTGSPGSLSYSNGIIFGGTLKRWFASGSVSGDQGLFPIGLSAEYRPLSAVSTGDITTGGTISASHTDATSATDVSIVDGGATIERTHDMSLDFALADGIAGGTFDVDVTNTKLSTTGSIADIRVTKDGGVVGTHAAATGTIDNPTAKRKGVSMSDLSGSWKIGTTDKSASPLPIVLIDFSATISDNTQVMLEWTTASEVNNDFFTVERSTNGLTFEVIAEVPGSGTSNRRMDYEAHDDAPLEGVSYYRLKQTDFDGKFEYFKIVAVNLERNADGSCVFKVFPNPCIGQCTVDLSECQHNENAEIKVEMIDAAGRLVYSSVPYRDFEGSFQFNIDTSNNLKPGVYIVRGTSGSESYHSKVIVK